jgi:integrase
MSPEQGYCGSNPANLEKRNGRRTADEREPEVLSLASVRKLLEAAQGYREGKLVPYVVLGLFCAIRPTELARLSWKEIDLEAKTVTIGAKMAKMRARRIVEVSDNAVTWLALPIKGPNWRKDFTEVRTLAGIKHWTQDVLRHTGISHHLSQHQHEGRTAVWAGNSPDVIQRHYRGLVKRAESAEFWALTPAP